jgi:formylglycine-generating enzyme required for sulfatase activity
MMGGPRTEKDNYNSERPEHKVTIVHRFAVSKFDVTVADWDACVWVHGCSEKRKRINLLRVRATREPWHWRRKKMPVTVTWDNAQEYVAWLRRMTGMSYRLLTEAEWEYAARAGTTTAYWWGDDIGNNNANCSGCGSKWDNTSTSPVGSFEPNSFGLYDMGGNVWQWVEDCSHPNYDGAPTDGSAWTTGDCVRRILRGGAWNERPARLRSSDRDWTDRGFRRENVGFRVGRTLIP